MSHRDELSEYSRTKSRQMFKLFLAVSGVIGALLLYQIVVLKLALPCRLMGGTPIFKTETVRVRSVSRTPEPPTQFSSETLDHCEFN